MLFIWLALLLVFVSFGLIVIIGAPYVPTKNKDIERLFRELKLKPNSLVVDLGSGDGRVLLAAAKASHRAVGYELNPVLFFTSWLRLRKYRDRADVNFKNLTKADISRADLVFIFTAQPFVNNLSNKFKRGLKPGAKVVSYGFSLPRKKITRKIGPMLVYQF